LSSVYTSTPTHAQGGIGDPRAESEVEAGGGGVACERGAEEVRAVGVEHAAVAQLGIVAAAAATTTTVLSMAMAGVRRGGAWRGLERGRLERESRSRF
jgi:hypothetical protein